MPAPDDSEELQQQPSEGERPPRASSSLPPAPDARASETESRERKRFESKLPGLIRRGIEKGIEAGLNTFEKSLETGRETTGAVREVLSEVRLPRDVASAVGKALQEAKLPREIAGAVLGQLDDAKNEALRIVAKEVRDFLEATDIATEIKNALTSLSFEVRTEIRFIPNEAGTGVKPDVKAKSRVKRVDDDRRKPRRGQHEEDAEEDEG